MCALSGEGREMMRTRLLLWRLAGAECWHGRVGEEASWGRESGFELAFAFAGEGFSETAGFGVLFVDGGLAGEVCGGRAGPLM